MLKSARASSATWLRGAFAAAAAAIAAPAFAQAPADQAPADATVEELVVTGRYGAGPDVRSLSARVSYADLDLTTEAGRDTLTQRIRSTANDLCRRLGEAGAGGTALLPSCEQVAVNSADEQRRLAIASATPRAYAVNPPAQPYVAPVGEPAPAAATAPTFTTQTVTNGPVPDTPENRRAYGGPMSASGRRTAPAGN